MQRDRVHNGLPIKLVTDYSNIPTGTRAAVDATGIMKDGVWWFTVKWHHYRPIPTRFPQDVIDTVWTSGCQIGRGGARTRRRRAGDCEDEARVSAFIDCLPNTGVRCALARGKAFVADDFDPKSI